MTNNVDVLKRVLEDSLEQFDIAAKAGSDSRAQFRKAHMMLFKTIERLEDDKFEDLVVSVGSLGEPLQPFVRYDIKHGDQVIAGLREALTGDVDVEAFKQCVVSLLLITHVLSPGIYEKRSVVEDDGTAQGHIIHLLSRVWVNLKPIEGIIITDYLEIVSIVEEIQEHFDIFRHNLGKSNSVDIRHTKSLVGFMDSVVHHLMIKGSNAAHVENAASNLSMMMRRVQAAVTHEGDPCHYVDFMSHLTDRFERLVDQEWFDRASLIPLYIELEDTFQHVMSTSHGDNVRSLLQEDVYAVLEDFKAVACRLNRTLGINEVPMMRASLSKLSERLKSIADAYTDISTGLLLDIESGLSDIKSELEELSKNDAMFTGGKPTGGMIGYIQLVLRALDDLESSDVLAYMRSSVPHPKYVESVRAKYLALMPQS